jgi:hypothetical protein
MLRDPAGTEVGRGVSYAEGRVVFRVPAGAYYLEPAAVAGYMGQAAEQALSVLGGSVSNIVLAYDTGIR